MNIIFLFLHLLQTTRVEIKIFYEAMCKDSATFFNGSFKPTYEDLNKSMKVTFNPFANGSVSLFMKQ